jgi:hypothetical protein
MGRGRAKAKQAKVARELKYSSHEPDLQKLKQELSGGPSEPSPLRQRTADDERDEEDDEYAHWAR